MKNHYIIGNTHTKDGTRLIFGRVTDISNGILTGWVERNAHLVDHRVQFEIPEKEVILDLGTKPHPGAVYGFDTAHRFRGAKVHPFFGRIAFFYSPEKETSEAIMQAFDAAQEIIEGLGFTFPEEAVWEIYPEGKGKYSGFYKRSPKPDKMPHRFGIKPESVGASDYVYTIIHEWVHHLHAENMTGNKLNAAWLKLFNTSIKQATVTKELSQHLLDTLLEGEEVPSDFKSGLDEENTLAWVTLIRTIRAERSISIKELDTLFRADFKDEIRSLWPLRIISRKELAPLISERSTLSADELLAESVTFYLTKKKIPAGIEKLVEKSLSFAKANKETV